MSQERIRLMAGLGAEIVHVSRDEGGFLGSIDRATRFAEDRYLTTDLYRKEPEHEHCLSPRIRLLSVHPAR